MSFSIFVLPFAIGLLGAAAVGLTVGFHDTDDQSVGLVRGVGAFLTGLLAGVVGRGLWGWVAASAGATFGVSPFFLADVPDPSLVLGAAIFSCVVLAPGYGLTRALALALRLRSLSPGVRSAAMRVPLRRVLRVGVVLSGAGVVVVVIAEAAIGLYGGANLELVAALAMIAAICGSYVMYRLVDRLDRGERRPAIVFTVCYATIGLGSFALTLATGASVGLMVLEILVPSSFMAIAPWLLVDLAPQQSLTTPQTLVEPEQPPAETSAGPPSSSGDTHVGRRALRLPSMIALTPFVGLTCLALGVVLIIATRGGGVPAPQSVVGSHDAPDIEALLPESVAGRQLAIWSVRGEATLKLWGLTAEEISTTKQTLTSMGVRLDDLVQATAGRSDVQADPPYFVLAFRIPADARDLLGGYAIASAGFTRETGDWQLEERVIGGKTVGVGPPDLLIQSEYQRGHPYLYGSADLDLSFIVITDDETWAEEAIRQLPS